MDTIAAADQLKKFINSIYPLQPTQWNDMAAAWQPFSAKRKTVLTKAGQDLIIKIKTALHYKH